MDSTPANLAILYYLRVCNGTAYKIGITNRSVSERFRTDMQFIDVLETWHFEHGADAMSAERSIIKQFSTEKYVGDPLLSSGNSELFRYDVLELDTS